MERYEQKGEWARVTHYSIRDDKKREREKEETRKNSEEWTGMIDCSEIQEEGGGNKKSGPE